MDVTDNKVGFFEIPVVSHLSQFGRFGRHIVRRSDVYTIMVRDYRGSRRMSYTFEFRRGHSRGHEGFRINWQNNRWDTSDCCFIPTDGETVSLADVCTYCESHADCARRALANAGFDDRSLALLVADIEETLGRAERKAA